MTNEMFKEKLIKLKSDVHSIIGNSLTLPRVILELIERGDQVTPEQIAAAIQSIDRAIKRTDLHFEDILENL